MDNEGLIGVWSARASARGQRILLYGAASRATVKLRSAPTYKRSFATNASIRSISLAPNHAAEYLLPASTTKEWMIAASVEAAHHAD
jgi:uncharacterized protein YfaQ (DUF2300 family)